MCIIIRNHRVTEEHERGPRISDAHVARLSEAGADGDGVGREGPEAVRVINRGIGDGATVGTGVDVAKVVGAGGAGS